MIFQSKWITTREFGELRPINVFHKAAREDKVEPGPIRNAHVHFRKKIQWPGKGKVLLRISADDYYKLYINETFAAQGPAPAYAECYHYNEMDITAFLKAGENIIAVHVYYQGIINRVWNSGDNRQGMIADILVDGQYLCGTDETWVYRRAEEYSGDLTGYQTQYLENMDFRKKEADWKKLDSREEGYLPAVVAGNDDHYFAGEAVECVQVYRVYPERKVHLGPGSWFLDFGTEITGQFIMKAKGITGQKVRILCGEETQEGNSCLARYQMRCNCNYEEECILSGESDELELFDYKAFRYVNLVTDRDNLDPDSFCAEVRHHRFREKCRLASDIPWAEKIWNLCVNTLKWGTQEGYLDCPSREKGQYLGDFTVSGLAHLYVTGDAALYRKALFDFAATAKVCEGLLGVAPGSLMQEIADFSLQYPGQLLRYYNYTKDFGTLQALYPVVAGIIRYFERYERQDGLLEKVDEKWNLVDWPQNLRDGYEYEAGGCTDDGANACHNILNAHYIGALKDQQKIQEILGIKAGEKAERVTDAYLKVFYDKKKKRFFDNPDKTHSALHSNVLPVFYGIAPKEAWNEIKRLIMERGLSCGTHFSYFVLKALGKMGYYEEELALLTNTGVHSWVNMLREGATTCYEAWGKEQKLNTSLCHPWSCAPIIVLIEDILKVDPASWSKGSADVVTLELMRYG